MIQDMSLDELTAQYFDVFKELGNIGAGNATTALASLLQTKVDMKVPQVTLAEFRNLGEMIGGDDQVMVGIYLGVEGDITGSMMFLTKKETGKVLVNKLMMQEPDGEDFNEMELSAMKEVGNIICGSYLNSLSTLTNMKIYPTIPDIAIDMATAILSVPAIQFGIMGDKILLIQTQFTDDVELDGFFILIPDLDSYQKILMSLGLS